ncbi:MAG: Trehalose/maltose import ATP-binding protein MalK [Methanosaeta sp. PtaU1.Bin028]|nr:MAG: Trehalose/maltose import ATP-binding protein MalK [Methanosaeta sp. PtaU1.Bin028]
MALLGPNGAGKSTLLLHLNGLLKGSGCVEVLGRKVNKENLMWVRRRVGMVFQDPEDQLIMPSLQEDVAFGPHNLGLCEDEVEANVRWALQAVGLEGLMHRASQSLSFGQKKRAALATALSMKPEILVLDEPTSNLDPRSRRDVVSLLRSLQSEGTTIITSTHDVNLVPMLADEVLLLNRRVMGHGAAADIMNGRELLEELDLELPIITDLFESLRGMGIYSGPAILRRKDALQALEDILGR